MNRRLTIHATNVTGLGASEVVVSFLEALDALETTFLDIVCYVPESGPVSKFKSSSGRIRIIKHKRFGPKSLSRVVECLFPYRFFEIGDELIVLGDVPLSVKARQIVLVHQPHLQSPRINPQSGRSMTFRVMRTLTALNSKFADRVIAQTVAIAEGLEQTYADWRSRSCVEVIGQPPPSWFNFRAWNARSLAQSDGLRLFYPAAGYPHKNHKIFEGLFELNTNQTIELITLTVETDRFSEQKSFLNYVGRLDHQSCLDQYRLADALVFPSTLESYGLPLVEAMFMGLPILVADLPYARVLCGDEAIYFDPQSTESLLAASEELKQRLINSWRPDWSASLKHVPSTWTGVVQAFLKIEKEA